MYGLKDDVDPVIFIIKQGKKILIPYWIFTCIAIILYWLFARNTISVLDTIRLLTCTGTINGLLHLLFFGYILFCYFITPYLYSIKKKITDCGFVKTTAVMAGVLILVVALGSLIDSYFAPDRVICYILGFFLAICKEKFDV